MLWKEHEAIFRQLDTTRPKWDKKLLDAAKEGDLDNLNKIIRGKPSRVTAVEGDGHSGYSPLMEAVSNNHLPCVKALLAAGSDPNYIGSGCITALGLALRPSLEGYDSAIELIKYRADVNQKTIAFFDRRYLIQTILDNIDSKYVALLLAAGANVFHKDQLHMDEYDSYYVSAKNDGKTALEYALCGNYNGEKCEKTIKLLQDAEKGILPLLEEVGLPPVSSWIAPSHVTQVNPPRQARR